MSGVLHIWTVYDHPTDFPNSFVARLFVVQDRTHGPTSTMMVADDIDRIRERLMQLGLSRIDRNPQDDPVIVESWL